MRKKTLAMAGLGVLVIISVVRTIGRSMSRHSESSPTQPASTAVPAETSRPAVGTAVKTFDRIKGRWEVESKAGAAFGPEELAAGKFETLTLTASTSWEEALGPNAAPANTFLHALCKSDSWKFLESHDLSLLIDGTERYSSHGTHRATAGTGFIVETVMWPVPPKCLRALADAKTLELRIGLYEGKVPQQTVDAIRDFSASLNDKSK